MASVPASTLSHKFRHCFVGAPDCWIRSVPPPHSAASPRTFCTCITFLHLIRPGVSIAPLRFFSSHEWLRKYTPEGCGAGGISYWARISYFCCAAQLRWLAWCKHGAWYVCATATHVRAQWFKLPSSAQRCLEERWVEPIYLTIISPTLCSKILSF